MRRLSDEERRARLSGRHLLAHQAKDVTEVAKSLFGLHSSDPSTVFLSTWARMDRFEVADLERALYRDRSLLRILGMRRTMFVVPTSDAPLVHHSSTAAMIDAQRSRATQIIESSGISDDGETWLRDVSSRTFAALKQRGQALAAELAQDVPELGEKITVKKKDGSIMGTFGVSTRVLFLLATEARIVRARPRGTWASSLYSWAPLEDWIGGPLPELPQAEAQTEVLTKWLRGFGPATETDIKWWTGWPVGQVRKALEPANVIEVEMEGGPGYLLADDAEAVETPTSWVAMLPSLDPTVMGWKQREWYLGDHSEHLFDRNGNAGPTVWADGRVVGGWAQRKDGDVVFRLLEDVGTETSEQIEKRAAGLQTWLGTTVVTPRFRTPLEKELATS
jgi:hypothetical protein